MHELIYTSVANWKLSPWELMELLDQSRIKNARLGITGILVYHNREFMQLLEGEKKAIFDLYDTICQDRRHTGVRLSWEGEIEGPSFRDWSMAFINANAIGLERVEGYSKYLEKGMSALNLTGNESTGREFLNLLRENFLNVA